MILDQRDKARLEEVRQRVDQKMYQALQLALADELEAEEIEKKETTEEGESTSEPIVEKSPEEEANENAPIERTNEDEAADNAKREEEIKQRAQHLRNQRDRIIQMKQKERTEKISKYLIKEKEKLKNQPRPKTARRPESAAKSAGQETETDSKEMAYRKTLAARLKAEVVFSDK